MKTDDIQKLVQYRSDQACDALEEAKILLGSGRTLGVVNRSYYAMFYAVLALLQKTEQVPTKHKGTISTFDREFVKEGIFPVEMSKDLHRAFELRQVSDYQVATPVSKEEAEEIYHKASSFVQAVVRYLSTPP